MSTQPGQCELIAINEAKVRELHNQLELHNLQAMSKIFKALADETRLKIAFVLKQAGELCVCDIAAIIGSTSATASHHLRFLSNIGLAKYRKEGKMVFYSLDDEHVEQLISLALAHAQEGKSL